MGIAQNSENNWIYKFNNDSSEVTRWLQQYIPDSIHTYRDQNGTEHELVIHSVDNAKDNTWCVDKTFAGKLNDDMVRKIIEKKLDAVVKDSLVKRWFHLCFDDVYILTKAHVQEDEIVPRQEFKYVARHGIFWGLGILLVLLLICTIMRYVVYRNYDIELVGVVIISVIFAAQIDEASLIDFLIFCTLVSVPSLLMLNYGFKTRQEKMARKREGWSTKPLFKYDGLMALNEEDANFTETKLLTTKLLWVDEKYRILPLKQWPFEEIDPFSAENIARVKKERKYGYCNTSGKVTVPLIYDAIGSFENGFARVVVEHDAFYINMEGKEVDAPKAKSEEETK